MEQYGRRLRVRIDGVPTVDNETSDEVLDKVKSLIKETSCVSLTKLLTGLTELERVTMTKNQMFIVKVLLFVLQLLGTEQCFMVVELI